MFDVVPLAIPGVCELRTKVHTDRRGRFVKLFHAQSFKAAGLETDFREAYYSTSSAGVIRGLHFQLPPQDHAKLVACIQGAAFDVAIDLRMGSPAYGNHAVLRLSADAGNAVYIPRGVAHGFCVEAGTAVMLYMTTTMYAPDTDTGIRWDSAGIPWPVEAPIVSDRDAGLVRFERFESPFHYDDVSAV